MMMMEASGCRRRICIMVSMPSMPPGMRSTSYPSSRSQVVGGPAAVTARSNPDVSQLLLRGRTIDHQRLRYHTLVNIPQFLPTDAGDGLSLADRKSTRLNSSHLGISYA